MDLSRTVLQGGPDVARRRVKFCLDQLEKYGLDASLTFNSTIGTRLTVEEVVGALVAAEQALREQADG
jgi:hypothetical protein